MVRGDDLRRARRLRAASMGAARPRWAGRALAIRSAWRAAMSWLVRWGCIGIISLQGRFRLLRHDRVGGSSGAVGSAYTAALGNWAPAGRPVRVVGGVYTGRRYDVVREEGAQD